MPAKIDNLWHREIKFVDAVRDMERHGIRVDIPRCRKQQAIGEATMNTIQRDLNGLSPTSPRDVSFLMEMSGLPVPLPNHKRSATTGKLSWDKTVMAEYEEIIESRGEDATNVAKLVLEFRGWSKTVSSNYKAYQKYADAEDILRPNFKIHGTTTTRLSCSDPALQQIPKETTKPWNGELKKVFIPRPGYVLLGRDYSQLEYRLGAGYAKQKNILDVFNEEGRDVFNEMAEAIFGEVTKEGRNQCKTIYYAKGYGAGEAKMVLLLGGDENKAKKVIRDWEQQHNKITVLNQEVNNVARQRGWIRLWTGRRRHFQYKSEARKGWNSLIQGGGAEIVKSAMIRCHEEFRNDPHCNQVLQVHDELLFEVPESRVDEYDERIKFLMENVEEEIDDFGVHFRTESKIWG